MKMAATAKKNLIERFILTNFVRKTPQLKRCHKVAAREAGTRPTNRNLKETDVSTGKFKALGRFLGKRREGLRES